MFKRIIAVISALLICTCFCSCSAKNENAVSLYDLKNVMAASTDKFSDMTYASSEDGEPESVFANISDMSYSKIDSFCVYYATNGTGNADEIAIIQVKSKNDLTEARKSLEAHLEKRKSLYSTYDKSQLKKLEGARVVTGGSCAALIVGDEADKIATAFNDYFNS